MSSNPKTNDMWYDKISKSPDDKYFLENMNLATDGIQFGSDCLVLRKYSELNPKFLLCGSMMKLLWMFSLRQDFKVRSPPQTVGSPLRRLLS